MKKSPLVGIRYYSNGNRLDFDGDTGGVATTKFNKEEQFTHGITSEYIKKNNRLQKSSWDEAIEVIINKIK